MRIEQGNGFLLSHLKDALSGSLLPAAFQRPYAWNREDVEALWRSICKGYPIGSLVQWRPEQGLPLATMGRSRLGPVQASGERWSTLLLDGQNRMASIAWSLTPTDADRPDPELLSPIERETWDPSQTLVCDWGTRSVRFVANTEAATTDRFPASCLADNRRFNQAMRSLWSEGQQNDAFFEWADLITERLRESRVGSIVLDAASPEEAVDAFLHIAKVGKPVAIEDLQAAMNWFRPDPLGEAEFTLRP